MRNGLIIATAFVLLVSATVLSALGPIASVLPNPVLPMVIYLGMAPDVRMLRGALLSFVLGHLLDAFSGGAMGLWTLLCVALFVAARTAGFRLILRGRAWQVIVTAAAALLAGLAVVALRAVFRTQGVFSASSPRYLALALVAPALATGAVGPWMFQLMRWLDTFRRRDEAAHLV